MAHKISIIIIILQMDLVEDYDDLIDRHYANVQEYHRIEPLESTANNRLFQARYRFNKFNFEKLTDELTPLFDGMHRVALLSRLWARPLNSWQGPIFSA